MNTTAVIKNRVVKLCGEKGISTDDLELLSGLSAVTIRNILEEKTNTTRLETVYMICVGLDINLDEFFDAPEFNILGKGN